MSKEMTPKDALEKISWRFPNEPSFREWCNIINQALDRFELLEKENQDWKEKATSFRKGNIGYCKKIIELENQIKKLEKENQALRDKLNINFEDCADELCEALTQRDKLYDENLELQKENQELEEKAKKYDELCMHNVMESQSFGDDLIQGILNSNKRVIERNKKLVKENQGLKNKNVALKIKVRAWEIQSEKYKKVIDILKDKANIRLHILTNTDGSKIYEIEFIFTYYSTIYEITQQEYDLLKEFLENV